MKQSNNIVKILKPIVKIWIKIYYNPKIIDANKIPNDKSLILAGNHIHAFDPLLAQISTQRILNSLAKKELQDSLFGWFFDLVGCIPVDFKSSNNKNALDTAIKRLESGCTINIYPEASRNYTSDLLPFKKGAVVMAKKTNTRIVPYAIIGKYKFRSKNLKIKFGNPIDITDLEINEANEILFKTIDKLKEDD